jgi:hypothetical protein
MGTNDPVCAAFYLYEGAVSNCINAATHKHESEQDEAFFKKCVEDMEVAKKQLKTTYHASKR